MNYPPDFESFWQAYPQRRGNPKRPAWQEWQRCLKQGATVEEMRHGARCYAAQCEDAADRQYVAHARTFLHQWRFEDYADTSPDEIRAEAGQLHRGEGRRSVSLFEVGARVAARGSQ